MRKNGLQDIKKKNRRLVLHTLFEQGPMSRIELAEKTGLSPSTVSGLVAGLLEDGWLVETGITVSTAGRNRIELAVNGRFGEVAVVKIGRDGVRMHLYSLDLTQHREVLLCDRYTAGNELLIAITAAIFAHCGSDGLRNGRLLGMGLLFQEDMQASDFNVVYSTSLSSANISLREALMTQFRVPVLEEYSQVYSFRDALGAAQATAPTNSVHLALGRQVFASIVLDGTPVAMRDGVRADITPLLGTANDLPALAQGEAETLSGQGMALESTGPKSALQQLSRQVAAFLVTLCALIPFERVSISGTPVRVKGFLEGVSNMVARKLFPLPPPEICAAEAEPSIAATAMARKLCSEALCRS